MKKFYKIAKSEKNDLSKDDILKMIKLMSEDDEDFVEYVENFDTKTKFTFSKYDRYISKKEAEKKRKLEEDRLELIIKEAQEKLKALKAEKNNGLFVRETQSSHNKTKSIEVITQRNIDQMSGKENNASKAIDVREALEILKEYIDDAKITIKGKAFVNVLTDNGYRTFKTLNELEEFEEMNDIESDEYNYGRIYSISIVSKQ